VDRLVGFAVVDTESRLLKSSDGGRWREIGRW
jgi:hypothetical protein